MKRIVSVYKYRIKPSEEQKNLMAQHFGGTRFIYNYCLAQRKEHYEKTGKTLGKYEQAKQITLLKRLPEYAWLNLLNAQSIEAAVHQVDIAYQNFFKRRKGFPKFKSKYGSVNTFYCRQANKVRADNLLQSVKFKEGIKVIWHRELPDNYDIKGVTYSRTPTDKYFASIVVEHDYIPREKTGKAIGIDIGLKNMIVTSDGETISNNKYTGQYAKELASAQKHLSRKKKGSNGYKRQKLKVAKIHEKIKNSRSDNIHKVSRRLSNNYDVICTENLNVKAMRKSYGKGFRKAVSDVAWGELLRCIDYKTAWDNNRMVKIDRFYPSTKTCNICGDINNKITLDMRTWVCNNGHQLDRDINAAINILNEGLKTL